MPTNPGRHGTESAILGLGAGFSRPAQPFNDADNSFENVELVEGGTVPAGSISTAELADDAVTAAKIAADVVGYSELKVFISAERTATGAAENIAHGLGVAPAHVLVVPTDLNVATVGAFTVTEGAHDATNVVVTVTLNKKYKVLAVAP